MTRRRQIQFSQLLVIVISWMIIGFLITCYDYFLLLSESVTSIAPSHSLPTELMFNVGAGLISGIMGGSFLVFYINVKYREKPYDFTIAAVCISFIVIVSIITLFMGIVHVFIETGKLSFDPVSKEI